MALEFTPDLVIGVSHIDGQHKELIKRINSVLAVGTGSANKEETERLINFLGEYVVKHFADEEELQKSSGFPQYEWHRGQHKEYLEEFKKLKDEYVKNGLTPGFTNALNNSVIAWVVRHIQTADKELGEFVNSK
ncbi:MAG: hemerythrin family protein [Treponema sp.]|nr:hemerythrin family protein [Treponema sp.]